MISCIATSKPAKSGESVIMMQKFTHVQTQVCKIIIQSRERGMLNADDSGLTVAAIMVGK